MMKKREDKKEKSVTESLLEELPLLGDFFKEIGKTEVFQKKFKEIDEKIEENLKKGEKKKWSFGAHISVRPIMQETKNDASEIALHEDYLYGKKNKKLTLAVKVPREEVHVEVKYKTLIITSEGFKKRIELPEYYKDIQKKKYKDGILILELTK